LEWLHAIPNGGERNKIQAGKLKAEGVRAGVADTFLPFPHAGFSGLYLEFKKPGFETRKNGGLSEKQIRFKDFVEKVGFRYKIAYNYLQAIEITIEYLS